MRFTASLANVVMKEWDKAWMKLLKREKIDVDLFLRYVDDCRLFVKSLNPGWRWSGTKFEYSKQQAEKDEEEGVTFVQRTTREFTKAMCDMTNFLTFTGEDCSMFVDEALPTLDTSLWWEGRQVKFRFYEKPTVGNQVLNKNTALPVDSLRSSLLQEAVRRLQNCSLDLDIQIKQQILSRYAEKLINSGHSIKSARIILVQGVVKFLWKVDLDKLPKEDTNHRPLYMDKTYNEEMRQITKYQAKMQWFKSKAPKEDEDSTGNKGWRETLVGAWRGAKCSQTPVLREGFSTVMSVPNTDGAALTRCLINCENRLAKMTKYNVKIVERSGVQLNRLFQRVQTPRTCHWIDCPVCTHSEAKGNTKCRSSNVVYEARCLECAELAKQGLISEAEVGVYIGETSRTLIERSREHVKCAEDLNTDSFITKHWSTRHSALNEYPRMQFSVVKQCKDAMSRQITEAIIIETKGNLNSKSEWGKNPLTRLQTDRNHWDDEIQKKKEDEVVEQFRTERLKERKKMKMHHMKTSNKEKSGKIIKACSGHRLRDDEIMVERDIKRMKMEPLECEDLARTSTTLNGTSSEVGDILDDLARTSTTLKSTDSEGGDSVDGLARTSTTLKSTSSKILENFDGSRSGRLDSLTCVDTEPKDHIDWRIVSMEHCNDWRFVSTMHHHGLVTTVSNEASYSSMRAHTADENKMKIKLAVEAWKQILKCRKSITSNEKKKGRKKSSVRSKDGVDSRGSKILLDWCVKKVDTSTDVDFVTDGDCNNLSLQCYRYNTTAIGPDMDNNEVPKVHEDAASEDEEPSPPEPSTSKGVTKCTRKGEKETKHEKGKDSTTDSDENCVHWKCTSTPKKKHQPPKRKMEAPTRMKRFLRPASRSELDLAKKKLDEGLNVELGTDSSTELDGMNIDDESHVELSKIEGKGSGDTDSSPELDERKIDELGTDSSAELDGMKIDDESHVGLLKIEGKGSGDTDSSLELDERLIDDESQAGILKREGKGSGDTDNMPEFDTTSSSILSEIRPILDENNIDQISPRWESSDPDVTGAILGLLGENPEKISNPFQLSDRIRNELIDRAERTGARALLWDLPTFNDVGGRGTITSVWNRLKSNSFVRGCKRVRSSDGSEVSDESKKLKISLDVSGTCDMINNIELSQDGNVDLVMSDVEDGGIREEHLSEAEVSFGPQEEAESLEIEAIGVEGLADQWHSESYSDMMNVSGHSSMPRLATSESESSYDFYESSTQDSGMIEELAGNVTNLCRPRSIVTVDRGVVTETGPQIPISLGLSGRVSSDWEEVLDEYGEPTGMERMSFKLNVLDGSTESIDDEWDRVRRENGMGDGINSTRHAEDEYAVLDETSSESDGYQADESGRESSQLSTVSSNADGSYALGRRRTTLRSPLSGENDSYALGRRRTTLRSPRCGENDSHDLSRRRTTLRSHERDYKTDALDRTRTTLSSSSSESQSVQRSMDDSDDQNRERENQGLREVCVAAQGGGTWVALNDSKDSDLDKSEQGDNDLIFETLSEELEEASMNGEDTKENEVDSNARIHGVGPNSNVRKL